MFEPISRSLSLLSSFAVLGFFLGAFYEIIRIIRLFKRQSVLAVGITDFVFMSAAALVVFAYSMELGGGSFRWYYVFGCVFGAAVYFLTLGRLISLASGFIVRCVKRTAAFIIRRIIKPVWRKTCEFTHVLTVKFGKISNLLGKHIRNSSKHLKSRAQILYNKNIKKRSARKAQAASSKISTTGERRNVIKGKVRAGTQIR
jgi:hypothetical protein